jgi:hypothetical protein
MNSPDPFPKDYLYIFLFNLPERKGEKKSSPLMGDFS